jgi:hypothetical protein
MTVGITELPPEGMQLGGVALAGDAERGTKTTEGLSLLFTTAGITVQGPQPQIERLLVWSGLDSATCREKIELPDGRNAAVLELTSGGQAIRFLLPTENVSPGQVAYLDAALPAWLTRYKGQAAPSPNGTSPSSAPPAPPDTPAPDGRTVAPAAAAGAGGAAATSDGSPNGSAAGHGDPGLASTVEQAPPPPSPPPFTSTAPPPPPGASTPPGPSFDPLSGQVLPPPPPGGLGRDAPPEGSLPPPPPPGGLGTAPAGTAGWDLSAGTAPAGSPWDNPPLGQAEPVAATPPKKARTWRKARPSAATPVPPPGALAPSEPPLDSPKNPLPLKMTLPPPPEAQDAPGAVTWQPPVDPTTGKVLWDTVPPGSDPLAAPEGPPKKSRGWRKGSKAAAVAATASVAAGAADSSTDGSDAEAGPLHAPDAPAGASPQLWGDPSSSSAVFGNRADPDDEPSARPAPKNNRTALVALLVVLLVVVIGGSAYFVATRNNTTTTTTVTPPTSASPAVADTALAASINLRLGDLPTGWTRSTATNQVARPPAAPLPAQVQANRALASCISVPYATVSGLFGDAVLPGQSSSVKSPTFQSGSNPNIQMYSMTTVMATTTRAQALATPFANPKFATCFGQYQSALVSSAIPGATAQVQTVTLVAPAGVKSYGYVTTFAFPNQGTQVVGEGFILGGRAETRLEPTTNGPAVPTDAFTSAYNAVTQRVAMAVDK